MKKYDCRTKEGKAYLEGSTNQITRIYKLLSRAEMAEAEVVKLKAELSQLRTQILESMPPCPGDNPCHCPRCTFEEGNR